MQTCPLELMDAGGLFALGTHGICLPEKCQGSPINSIFKYAQHDYNYNESDPQSATPMCNSDRTCCIRNREELKKYAFDTLACFKESHAHFCNYEDAIPAWLVNWANKNEWAKPILDWKETLGYVRACWCVNVLYVYTFPFSLSLLSFPPGTTR